MARVASTRDSRRLDAEVSAHELFCMCAPMCLHSIETIDETHRRFHCRADPTERVKHFEMILTKIRAIPERFEMEDTIAQAADCIEALMELAAVALALAHVWEYGVNQGKLLRCP